jgi:hypothetical protein
MSNENIPVEKLTRTYIKIRDKRAELSAKFKEEDDILKGQQEECVT